MEQDASILYDPSIKNILPHRKMYTLQIGNERFVLSGASLSSDAPSYFTNYFSNSANADKVLFIDRSPNVFKHIYAHLQGYHLEIEDAETFTGLYSDVLYYNLPQLRQIIVNSDYYYANVGGESIKIPKRILNTPGNTPNFFTISNGAMYRDLTGLISNMKWIRPPPQASTSLNRCPILFKELVNVLQGVEPEIRSPEHRKSLIKEARYYRFNGLVEKLMNVKIVYNAWRQREEIVVPLECIDLRCLVPSEEYVGYKRMYTEEPPRVLLVKVTDPDLIYHASAEESTRITVHGATLGHMSKLFEQFVNPQLHSVQHSSIVWPNDCSEPMGDACIEQCVFRLLAKGQLELIVMKHCENEQEWAKNVLM